jgi:hypothetical protein
VNKTNRCTEFQFYWCYYSTRFGQPFCPSSGVLSRTSASVHFMQLWWTICCLLLAAKWSQLHKLYQSWCMAKNSWWWAERLPETCRVVIPIKLEFSASVGFIHKESVMMHSHTIRIKGIFNKVISLKNLKNMYIVKFKYILWTLVEYFNREVADTPSALRKVLLKVYAACFAALCSYPEQGR